MRGGLVPSEFVATHPLEESCFRVIFNTKGTKVNGGHEEDEGYWEPIDSLSFVLFVHLRALRDKKTPATKAPNENAPDAPFLELVHRLDRDTSGCLMIAKKRSMLRTLHELLRDGGVDKRYLALVAGRVKGESLDAEFALRKNTLRGGERMVTVSPDGKPAHTRFRVVERYRGATLVEAELFTGRTHQIRVHAAALGHPLAGDPKYGDEAFNREMAELGLKRLFLHARSLAMKLPDGEELIVSAPLPEELEAVLQRLDRKGG